MYLIDRMVEARIEEAERRGDFQNLPSAGKPLNLEDDSMVPEELRTAYRLLRNSGFIPEEVRLRKEIHEVEDLLAAAKDQSLKDQHSKRLRLLMDRLGQERGMKPVLSADYFDQVCQRLERR
ncbi:MULTISPECIES: DnaJ family domain-containing protein [unclassified Ectothiorhodospira]|uniref:DnaJ family domain-containing protein n=1 Tax=unclassified Ectothiorhodospira TaxID=2684909 RepID=UPI001EE85165|nr:MULTISPECIES: DnaJ family domain-containing protein [unclassified Ectothiorhodospira]MCG5516672.1 DUF1992 domain-containing protein [Ectothiorhodospira sp. 9100]MCG5520072.1 DUF1992 domain-containing protein [Ectothiorhodospira sp. 9905]